MKTHLLFCLICLALIVNAQQKDLTGEWKFSDNKEMPGFHLEAFDDNNWSTIKLPSKISQFSSNKIEQRYFYFRLNFSLPDEMVKKELVLFSGIIDDADETWFNGVLIGKTGKFPPSDQSAWDTQRKYVVPQDLVKKNNVIAIKVYNGIGDGGIYGGRLCVMTRKTYKQEVKERSKNKKSYHYLTTSNGLISAVYNDESHLIEALYPHIFSYHDSAHAVQPVLTSLKINIDEKPMAVQYLQNTHIIQAKYKNFKVSYFASFTQENKVLYAVVEGSNSKIDRINFSFNPGSAYTVNLVKDFNNKKIFSWAFTDNLHKVLSDPISSLSGNLLENEKAFMRSFIDRCTLPKSLTPNERRVAEQSITIMKMAQCNHKEIYPLAGGQILASLRPGVWAISWVRDAAYAIEAMANIGMYQEAKDGLQFMLRASPTSQYEHFVHTDGIDYGIGMPYQISVTRYFGNGREESDYAPPFGPNIEIDDFGLFLIAYCKYLGLSKDSAFFHTWKKVIADKVIRPIIHNITKDDILRRDSGPWEHHLPGKQFVFTNIVCARGMELYAEILQSYGESDPELERQINRLIKGIETHFYRNGFYRGNAQELLASDHHYFDAASFEGFACGLFKNRETFFTHMGEYNKHLLAKHDGKRGYIRFDSQDSYENQEWPFAGLRLAIAYKQFGDKKRSDQLIERITSFAAENHHQIPEIIGLEDQEYKGAIPMVGYGAGAYLLALITKYKN